MEIEKVIRIVATFIAVAAFAVWIATELFFPGTSRFFVRLPQLIVLLYCLWLVWHGTASKKQNENSNR